MKPHLIKPHPSSTILPIVIQKRTPMNTKAPRIVLALLLAFSLVPTVNVMRGLRAVAYAEDGALAAANGAAADGAAADGAADATAGHAAGTSGTDNATDNAAATGTSGTDVTNAADTATAHQASGATTAAIEDKDEVIYALLSADGVPHSGYVVNHFQVDEPGTLVDYGAYRAATNLSTTASIGQDAGRVSVVVEPGDFYYEGVLSDVELPWLIDIVYTLDGERIQPAQLAGASGRLGIQVKTRQNPKVDPVFFENYLLQIQMTFDASRTKDVNAPAATIASAGADKQVVFMVLPERAGDLTMTARVTDFEMSSIQISALPFSMVFDIPDSADMLSDMATLVDAIGALNEGASRLKDGVTNMEGGAAELSSGSAGFDKGLSLLSGNSANLTVASAQIDGALTTIAQQLAGGAVDPEQIAVLISGLRQLSAGLSSADSSQPGLAEGLSQVQSGIYAAVASMDAYVAALVPVGQQAIQDLYGDSALAGLSANSQATIGELVNTNTQAAYVRGAWYGPSGNDGVKGGLESAAAGLSQSVGSCQYMAGQLDVIANGLESGLGELAQLQTLAAYLGELSRNYTSFNEGLATYASGLDTLAVNYKVFNEGLAQFARGVGDLSGGVSSLRDGTFELYVNVEDLPNILQKEIDSYLADYQKDDFIPVSFVSANNEHVARVQFVLLTDAITVPAPPEEAPANQPAPTFWDRLIALFRR
jgi:X-X-X-Leu-X-X-Gly heptad repeat protein